MSVRWEFAYAKSASLELMDAKAVREEADEQLKPDQLTLTIGYDEVFGLVGTREELREFARRVSEAVETEPATVEDDEDE